MFNRNRCCIEIMTAQAFLENKLLFNRNRCCIEIAGRFVQNSNDDKFNRNRCCIEIIQQSVEFAIENCLIETGAVLKCKYILPCCLHSLLFNRNRCCIEI